MTGERFDILTCFDACVDMVVELGQAELEFDQKEKLVPSAALYLGGSAGIFASQCAKLGLAATGVGVVGDDHFGRVVLSELAQNGVDCRYIKTLPEIRTAVGVALNRQADRMILTFDESIAVVTPGMVTDEVLERCGHLHIASYYLLRGLAGGFEDILRRAKRRGLTTSLDTNWDPAERWELPEGILRHTDLLLPNENEALLLTGCEELDEAAARLGRYGAAVVVKRGEKGARAYKDGKMTEQAPPPARVADTIGAGDSFDAGFIFAWRRGMPPEACLELGNFCGAANVRRHGGLAGQPTWRQVPRHLI